MTAPGPGPVAAPAVLTHPLLAERGAEHGFGTRDLPLPADLLRPRQVHGARVASAAECAGPHPVEADVVVSRRAGLRVGVVTADCVPVLIATAGATAVAAVHAGWRGLARGVVAAGVDALRHGRASHASTPVGDGASAAREEAAELAAVIGPHIGPCCYEVDGPVIDALARRFVQLDAALAPSRPGHAMLDLGALCRTALAAAGVPPAHIGGFPQACTRCDARRFHSYRRDGPRSGRLVHYIAARSDSQGLA